MMLNPQLLNAVAVDLGRLDFSADNARIAELEAGVARMHDAIASADARCSEIRNKVEELRHPELQRGEVADALMTELSPSEAAAITRGGGELVEERTTLAEGMSELRRRIG